MTCESNRAKYPKTKKWQAVAYLIADDDFPIDSTYPEQIDSNEALQHRRPKVFNHYFGNVTIDYSNPSLA